MMEKPDINLMQEAMSQTVSEIMDDIDSIYKEALEFNGIGIDDLLFTDRVQFEYGTFGKQQLLLIDGNLAVTVEHVHNLEKFEMSIEVTKHYLEDHIKRTKELIDSWDKEEQKHDRV